MAFGGLEAWKVDMVISLLVAGVCYYLEGSFATNLRPMPDCHSGLKTLGCVYCTSACWRRAIFHLRIRNLPVSYTAHHGDRLVAKTELPWCRRPPLECERPRVHSFSIRYGRCVGELSIQAFEPSRKMAAAANSICGFVTATANICKIFVDGGA